MVVQQSLSIKEVLNDHFSLETSSSPNAIVTDRTWAAVILDLIWIISAAFTIYMGDCKSNLIFILCNDERIRRTELYAGLILIYINLAVMVHAAIYSTEAERENQMPDILTPCLHPIMILMALLSFSLFSYAMWPVWGSLTLTLVLILFAGCLVALTYIPIPNFQGFRTERIGDSTEY